MTTLDLDATQLDYEDTGTGTPIVLVHGTGGSRQTWNGCVESLAQDHRVIAYSRRAYGDSTGSPVRDYRDHAQDLEALIEHLDAAPATVVGWSSGGVVAIDLALRRPDLIGVLVLVEPPVHGQLHPSAEGLSVIARLQLLRATGRRDRGVERFYRFAGSYHDGGSCWDEMPEDDKSRFMANAATTASEFNPSLHPMTGEYLRLGVIGSLQTPVHLLQGDRTNPWFAALCKRLVQTLANVEVHRVAGASHILHYDAPEAFVAAVRDAAAATA